MTVNWKTNALRECMLRNPVVVQRSKSRNLKEVLCYGLLVHGSDGLCHVQMSVVSKLFFSKCNTMEKIS